MKKFFKLQYILPIIAILFTLLAYWQGLFIDVGRDAGKYATVAKEIIENNNWIHLTILGDAYDQKPHLLFWLGAIGYSIGGYSNFWFKLFPVVFVFISFYATYRLGRSLYNKRVGFFAALFAFFSFIYFHYSMDIHTDTLLQTFIVIGLWQFFDFIKYRKSYNVYLGFVALGFGMLSKGPIAIAIPAFAVLGHILSTKNYKLLLNYRWYVGIILSFIIASPAIYHLYESFGWNGIVFFFWDNNVGRVTGTYHSTYTDPLYYFHSSLYLLLPWSLLFFYAAYLDFKDVSKNNFKREEYFTFWGIWIYFVIINLSQAQLPNYIFSIVPLIFILVAKWVDIGITSKDIILVRFAKIQKYVVLFLWIAIAAGIFYFTPPSTLLFYIIISILLIAVLISYLTLKKEVCLILYPSMLTFSAIAILLNTNINPYFYSFQAVPKAARYYNEYAEKSDKLYNYRYSQYELYFYSNKSATNISNYNELSEAIKSGESWIFTNEDGYKDIMKFDNHPEKIIHYKHMFINHTSRFILPSTRNKNLEKMYLIKF